MEAQTEVQTAKSPLRDQNNAGHFFDNEGKSVKINPKSQASAIFGWFAAQVEEVEGATAHWISFEDCLSLFSSKPSSDAWKGDLVNFFKEFEYQFSSGKICERMGCSKMWGRLCFSL
jgi:hypothetical protein